MIGLGAVILYSVLLHLSGQPQTLPCDVRTWSRYFPHRALITAVCQNPNGMGGLLSPERRAWPRSLELKATPYLLKDGDLAAEPIDVPAVKEITAHNQMTWIPGDWCQMPGQFITYDDKTNNAACAHWKCADTSRILLPPDGNGKFWCHRVQP